MLSHFILGDQVQIYRREETRFWHCAATIDGRRYRKSTEQDSLAHAKEIAEDWYFELRGQARAGLLETKTKTFKDAADKFLEEYPVITEGQRSKKWIDGHAIRLRVHLLPFFGDLDLSKVTGGKVQDYRVHRIKTAGEKNPASKSNRPVTKKPPARSTIHDEISTLRQVLKTAIRHGWMASLPDLSPPYKSQGKIIHRPWFSPAEYKQLYAATRENIKKVPKRFRWDAEQVHDFVLFMANTGLRPDEARNLQHRDVEIVKDAATGETILEIEVRGKRGFGYCKSTTGAVRPYERLLRRAKPEIKPSDYEATMDEAAIQMEPAFPQPMDHLFPGNHIRMFNTILKNAKLRRDRDGNARTAYSLRHTYICLRLMEGADIYQIAKNCRTSVEMIEKFYAAHIKNTLDAAAINVRRPKTAVRNPEPEEPANTDI